MGVRTHTIELMTRGNAQMLDITDEISKGVDDSDFTNGIVTVFCPSATSALTTIEYESGCLEDLERLFDEIIPSDHHYAHNARWGDGNGHSHVRAALLGPSLTIPFVESRLTLGTWQQVIFVDFDNRSRQRRLIMQLIGE
ncbi:MAG: secondary thiamine-phosphate synthase enzyme YjbQ [Candidatus Promineifilaceae bacterium]|nr:secondary thiamine-phosphate synthase enzyme YjbQ [Candidatus Promineifilaceae bacterium]